MTIDEATLAKARAAWDAVEHDEQDAQELRQRLMFIRDELSTAFNRLDAAWVKVNADERLRETLRAQIAWLMSNVGGTGPIDPALETLRYLTDLTEFPRGRPSKAKGSGVNLNAVRAVAGALGVRSYGSNDRDKPLPGERQLLAVFQALEKPVTLVNIRSALKAP